MLALLFCLIYLSRCAYLYFVSKLPSDMERRTSPRAIDSKEDAIAADEPGDDRESDQFQEDDDDVLVDAMDEVLLPDNAPIIPKRRQSSIVDSAGITENILIADYNAPPVRRVLPKEDCSFTQTVLDSGFSSISDMHDPVSTRRVADSLDGLPITRPPMNDECNTGRQEALVHVPVLKDANCYNMNHKYRGKCVVFNHEDFENDFEPRQGSTTDALRIERTFKTLGFTVDIYDNFYYSEVLAKLSELSEEDHTDNDCICIFVLTHGISNDLICAKDVAYKSDNVWKPFTADRCITLAGKPKLFFFQACRGDQLDGGLTVARRSSERSETDSAMASYKIPTHADFLIAHSTVQGFYSWRNPEEGTWYVQCLCDVLEKYWQVKDLISMMTITARMVATEYSSYDEVDSEKHDQKQVPSMTSMLIRDVYFGMKSE